MKQTTKVIIAIFCIGILVIGVIFFTSQLGNDTSGDADPGSAQTESSDLQKETELEDDPTAKEYDNGIVFEEEGEDVEVSVKEAPEKDFIGSWAATSSQSEYFYGNVDIKIAADGTWSGNITDEQLSGRWKKQGKGLYLTSDLINLTLQFSSDNNLLMQQVYEDSDDEAVIMVLTRK